MASPRLRFEVDPSGIFVVHYATAEELRPDRQEELIAQVRLAGQRGPTAITFVVPAGILRIDPSVPSFWLQHTGDPALRVVAIAVVSPSVAVRAAATGFGIANALRRSKVVVQSFRELPLALAWIRTQLKASLAIPTGA